jgi:glycosyltransferase involved in cell wall biosynthesis
MVYFDHPETLNRNFVAWYRFMLPRLARRVRRVITVSSFVKQRIVEQVGIPAEKIVVIPNGVSPRFSPDAIAGRDATTAQLGIPSARYILALGSIEPRKNLSRLLRAWGQIQSSLPGDLWLVVAGAHGNAGIFKSVNAGNLPQRVFLTGHVPDEALPSLVAGAVAMAYPSLYEGFGLPVLEAMASGVPVLAGDCAAIREVVEGAGVLVNPLDEKAIADALAHLLSDVALRSELSAKGLERAKRFSWDVSARTTWDVLQEAAQEGS